jgi:hypothetical protein
MIGNHSGLYESINKLEQQLLEARESLGLLQIQYHHQATLLESCETALQGRDEKLLEANAKIERLTTAMVQTDYECRLRFDHPEPYETLLSQAIKESPTQSLALHDADVIDSIAEASDGCVEFHKSPYYFLKNEAKILRNSVKEGE